ncbi:MAG: iron donor protein CyaY [Calditrichaeota bacterium]|nr:MAG: iron donor protein CyaY [Calditrichota bacterium]
MADKKILLAIDETLESILDQIEENEDLDIEFSDGKLVIEFEDGIKYIINRQSAADQIWFAEPNGGWHFDYKDSEWICTKTNREIKAFLSELMSIKMGEKVEIK